MIKEIHLVYCEANTKYDLFIDGEWRGKHYNVPEALKQIAREEKNKR